MNTRFAILPESKPIFSTWTLKNKTGQLTLVQNQHLERVIATYGPKSIYNHNNFVHWKKYSNTASPVCDLLLYAQTSWKKLTDIVDELKSFDCNMIFLAINKYFLLVDHADNSLDDNYDLAIKQVIERLMPNYIVCGYEYNPLETGNVGNFIVPDNRFVICKKV